MIEFRSGQARMPALPGCAPRMRSQDALPGCALRSLRAPRFKLIVHMPAFEQIIEQENDHDRRRDAESDLRIMLFENVRRLFAITHRHPAFQGESDATT